MKYIYCLLMLLISINISAQQKNWSNGHTFAVVVGISDYQDEGIPDLRFADRDAKAFAEFLRSKAGGSLDNDHLRLLINEQATQAQFASALDWLWETVGENDRAFIYFSGHGDVEKKSLTQPGFLLCWDAPSKVYMAGGAFSLGMLQEVISSMSIQNKAQVILVADACRAGKLSGSNVGGAQITGYNLAKQYANEIKILSCQPEEYSMEGEQWGGGRGAFSYHLLDGLYGLADNNSDQSINLMEIGRYVERKVAAEVAPQSQSPMTIGNRAEKLTDVFPDILLALEESKKGKLKTLAATDTRGMEEEVLANADAKVVEMYRAFQTSLAQKNFFEPALANADIYYEQLSKEPQLQRLHSSMRRNFAAALQDSAQQIINIWLKADVQELACIGKSIKLESIPKQLERAAQLLGEGHYMYNSLVARKLTFEGVLCDPSYKKEEAKNRECLSYFQQSIKLEPELPINWHQMGLIYETLGKTDSAIWCARKANDLASGWVLPYVDLGYELMRHDKYDEVLQLMKEANAVDSLHPYVYNQWGVYLTSFPGKDSASMAKGFEYFEKYKDKGGAMYPCWHFNYAALLREVGRMEEAADEMKKAIALDPTNPEFWYRLGHTYFMGRNYEQALEAYRMTAQLDSTEHKGWGSMGATLIALGRLEEAIAPYEKAIELNHYDAIVKKDNWNSLSYIYLRLKRYDEARPIISKLLEEDSTYMPGWNNLGNSYRLVGQYEEAEKYYLKAISINPDFNRTYVNLCFLKIKMGELEAALDYLEKAIEKGYNNYNEISNNFKELEELPAWQGLMRKHFPDQFKD